MIQSDAALLAALVTAAAPSLLTPSPAPGVICSGGQLCAGDLLVHGPAPAPHLGAQLAGGTLARVTSLLTQMRGGGGSTRPDTLTHRLAHGYRVSAGQPGLGSFHNQTPDGCLPAWAGGHGLRGQRTRGTGAFVTQGLATMVTTIQFLVANFSAIEISRTSDIETAENLASTLTTETH